MSFEFDLNLGSMNVGMFQHQQEVFNLNKFRSSISQWNTDSSQSYLTVDITVNNTVKCQVARTDVYAGTQQLYSENFHHESTREAETK